MAGRPLLWQHDDREVIGRITAGESRDDGVHVTADIVPTSRGRDVQTLILSGTATGLSLGFTPAQSRRLQSGEIEYSSVVCHEISCTPTPAFPTAQITESRMMSEDQTTPQTTTDDTAVVALSERIAELEERFDATRSQQTQPARTLSVPDAFAVGLVDYARTRRNLALADVVSGNNAGILPPDWSSEVRRYVDASRPLINASGKMAFPATGATLYVPRVLQEVLVGPRGQEKTEVPSRAMQTGQDNYQAEFAAGAVDVSLELIAMSDPSIVSLVAVSLLEAYAAHSETVHVTNTENAATPVGLLDTTSYKTLIDDLIGNSIAIRQATGMPGDYVAATSDDWAAILGLVDSDNRRIFATNGASNADGAASLTAQMLNVGGINIFHSHASTTSVMFNSKSLRVSEKTPATVAADNVALLGRDFGIWGAIITVPMYPDGIRAFAPVGP